MPGEGVLGTKRRVVKWESPGLCSDVQGRVGMSLVALKEAVEMRESSKSGQDNLLLVL